MSSKKRQSLPEIPRFGRALCGDLIQAERREWWLANGLGAYAAGTVAGSLPRCYHGLLVAPVYPPLGRVLVLAKADATLVEGDRSRPLHTNRWGSGAVSPEGYVHVESFRLEGRMPVWRYAVGAGHIERRIWMNHGANRIYVAWRFEPLDPGDPHPNDVPARSLKVRLLANARDHHGNARAGHFDPLVEVEKGRLSMVVPGAFALHVRIPPTATCTSGKRTCRYARANGRARRPVWRTARSRTRLQQWSALSNGTGRSRPGPGRSPAPWRHGGG